MTTRTTQGAATDTASSRFTEQSTELLRGVRQAGTRYVDLYETAANKAVSAERRIAGTARPVWVKTLIESHANLAAGLNETYVSTARELLR